MCVYETYLSSSYNTPSFNHSFTQKVDGIFTLSIHEAIKRNMRESTWLKIKPSRITAAHSLIHTQTHTHIHADIHSIYCRDHLGCGKESIDLIKKNWLYRLLPTPLSQSLQSPLPTPTHTHSHTNTHTFMWI